MAGVYEYETACVSYEHEKIMLSLSLSLSDQEDSLTNKQNPQKKSMGPLPPFPDKENARYANFRLIR